MAPAFVLPSNELPPSALQHWVEVELARRWGEGFTDGGMIVTPPDELFRRTTLPPTDQEVAEEDQDRVIRSTWKAERVHNCFRLWRPQNEVDASRIPRPPSTPPVVPSASTVYRDLVSRMSRPEGMAGLEYYRDMIPTSSLRRQLRIDRLPFARFNGGVLDRVRPVTPGIHTPYLYVAGPTPGAPFAMHVEDWNLFSMNYLHAGAPKCWIVVHPSSRATLETRLYDYARKIWGPEWSNAPCTQFLRHLSLWTAIQVLDEWGVQYTRLVQRPGDLVVTAPGAYHEGWNNGWNVAEAINYGDGATVERARGYRSCAWGCWPDDDVWDPVRLRVRPRPSDAPATTRLHWVGASSLAGNKTPESRPAVRGGGGREVRKLLEAVVEEDDGQAETEGLKPAAKGGRGGRRGRRAR